MTANRIPPPDLAANLRDQARTLGFDLFGIAPAVTPQGYHRLIEWVEAGFAAEMNYFADRIDAYGDPSKVLDGAASIIVMTYPYPQDTDAAESQTSRPSGRVARYARLGADYHDVIHPLLKQLKHTIEQACPDAISRGVVDTAPLMEREFATLAGLGWAGKNSLLLSKNRGSYFFLASILTTVVFPYNNPHETSHCGTCTRCLDACPTDAFAAPGVVDSRRCISYLTIEHRGPISHELRLGMGDRLFGCDICQEVCPWNEHARKLTPDRSLRNDRSEIDGRIDLIELLSMDDVAFREAFRHTPMWRPRRRGMLRNAAICAGNAKDVRAAEILSRRLDDSEPLIRGAAAWALGQIGGCHPVLTKRLEIEVDDSVRVEIEAALAQGE